MPASGRHRPEGGGDSDRHPHGPRPRPRRLADPRARSPKAIGCGPVGIAHGRRVARRERELTGSWGRTNVRFEALESFLPSFRGPHASAGFRVFGAAMTYIAYLDEFGHAGGLQPNSTCTGWRPTRPRSAWRPGLCRCRDRPAWSTPHARASRATATRHRSRTPAPEAPTA